MKHNKLFQLRQHEKKVLRTNWGYKEQCPRRNKKLGGKAKPSVMRQKQTQSCIWPKKCNGILTANNPFRHNIRIRQTTVL